MARPLAALLFLVLVAGLGLWLFSPGRPSAPAAARPETWAPAQPSPRLAPPPASNPSMPPGAPAAPPAGCEAPAFTAAAAVNAASLAALPVTGFGRDEWGWEIYAPLIGQSIGAACPPDSPAFAQALGAWEKAHGLPADGVMDLAALEALRVGWHARRPYVAATRHGGCPPPPPPEALGLIKGYGDKPVQLRKAALEAWARMVAAARAAEPAIAADPRLLAIFSGFRGPEEEMARCLDGGCGGPTRANCSAHRTGLAADLFVGSAPGLRPESTEDANRLFQTRGVAYRWLVAHAADYGWVNYPFEPWHWEWTGEAP